MVIYLSGDVDEEARLDELTPRQIVAALDKHVVGQNAAKRAVAIALRNRVRRQKLPPEMAVDVMREEKIGEVAEKAENNAEERILDLLLPPRSSTTFYDFDSDAG